MKREDILLALKNAEEQTVSLIENARKESERNIQKAKHDAALRVEGEKAKIGLMKEGITASKLAGMEDEARIIKERGKQRAEKLRRVSEENMNRAIGKLIDAFERDVDV